MLEYIQHQYHHEELRLGLLAISHVGLVVADFAVVFDVPWCAVIFLLWVDCVRCSLAIDGICEQSCLDHRNNQKYDWPKHMNKNHAGFNKEEKHRQHNHD